MNFRIAFKFSVILLGFCFPIIGNAQSLASELIIKLEVEHQQNASNALYLIDSTFEANKQISASLKTELYIWKAGAHIYLNQFDSTKYYGEQALQDFVPFNALSLARAKLFTSVAHYFQGNYTRAIPLLLEGLNEPALNQDLPLKVKMLRTIGEYYRASDNQDPALNYLEQGLVLADEINDEENRAFILNRLGVVYYQKEEHEISEKYLNQSMNLARENGFDKIITMNMNDLGELYFATKNYVKSIELYELALERAADELDKINTLNNMARLESEINRLDDALAHGQQAFLLAQKAKVLTFQVDASKIIADTYEIKKDYESATKYYNLYITLREQLFEVEKNKQIVEVETQYQTAQKEQEIELLTEQELIQRNQKRVYLISLLLVSLIMVILILLIVYIRKQSGLIKQQNVRLDELNNTKNKFFSIIAHDLRSPMIALQGVGQKLDYFIKRDKQEKLLEMGGKIDQSIDQLNHLLNNLLNWASSESSGIPYLPKPLDLKQLVTENIDLYKSLAEAKGVELIDESSIATVFADANTVTTIIRNLLSNAIKFSPEGGSVRITNYSKEGLVGLSIKDEGRGMDQAKVEAILNGNVATELGSKGEKGFGLGLKLCQEFTQLNHGQMNIQSVKNQGSTFAFALPQNSNGLVTEMKVA